MKKIKLKSNVVNPITLEIKPYMNRTFFPNVIAEVNDDVYSKYKEYFFDLVIEEPKPKEVEIEVVKEEPKKYYNKKNRKK